ncbi:MAG TPA: phosphoribosylformylglycinamidine cyclo-ligase [Acidimicrobiia bacterium]|nr:phosphoribosylformylglycinamidine cyclo-ligase [Acidimicrobiia bacterium]
MTSYRQAGVDLVGAERHVANISSVVTGTWATNVIGGFGGFAAGVEIPDGYQRPVLMMSVDGVGTKLELARLSGHWDGVGTDLVAMCVDDLAAVGARPIGFVDYLAVGALNEDRDLAIVTSIAAACRLAGCPLLGGETAEHPGVMDPDAIDLAGAVVGVVEHGKELSPGRVAVGDRLVGLQSPNLRSNGFSLIRSLFADDLHQHLDSFLEPSVIYSPAVQKAVATGAVHSAAHITGGGIVGNIPRSLPRHLGASIDTRTWRTPPIFQMVAAKGVNQDDMFRTFNMGIGFCLVVDPAGLDEVLQLTAEHEPALIGVVTSGGGLEIQ